MKKENINFVSSCLPWVLFGIVTIVPLLFWGNSRGWVFAGMNALSLFPILGVLAWGIMWTHFAIGSIRIVYPEIPKNILYSKISGYLVLLLILLHPNLLVIGQWKTRGLLPPGSLYGYVNSSLKIFIFFGTLSLLTFLSYEIFERMKSKRWVKNNWRWISLSQVVAMSLIFVHALALGGLLNNPRFEFYWIALGALLIPCFGLILRNDWKTKN